MTKLGILIFTGTILYGLIQLPPLPTLPSPEDVNCKCSMKSWPGNKMTGAYFNLSLPWFTHRTTLQELRARHPNIPFNMLNDGEKKRCSLLPTIFRYRQEHFLTQYCNVRNYRIILRYIETTEKLSGVNHRLLKKRIRPARYSNLPPQKFKRRLQLIQ